MLYEFFDCLEKAEISSAVLNAEKDTFHYYAVPMVTDFLEHLVICEIDLVN